MEVKGLPPKSLLVEASRTKHYFDLEYNPVLKKDRKGNVWWPNATSFAELVGNEDPDFADFLDRCTAWKPKDRMKPSEAIQHNWVKKVLDGIKKKDSQKIDKLPHL